MDGKTPTTKSWKTHKKLCEKHLTQTGLWQEAKHHWQMAWAKSGGNAELEILGEILIAAAKS